ILAAFRSHRTAPGLTPTPMVINVKVSLHYWPASVFHSHHRHYPSRLLSGSGSATTEPVDPPDCAAAGTLSLLRTGCRMESKCGGLRVLSGCRPPWQNNTSVTR
ncbi:Hypothetical predicted protein, partial [Marmota monax]